MRQERNGCRAKCPGWIIAAIGASAFVLGASAPPGAARQQCNLEPAGPALATGGTSDGVLEISARWDATVQCATTSRLEGTTAELTQRILIDFTSAGIRSSIQAHGPTQILIDFTGAGIRAAFGGQAQGNVTCDLSVCTIDLAFHGTSSDGEKVRGSAIIEVDRATHTVLSVRPSDYAISIAGQ